MPPPILIAPCACPALVVEAESLGISAVQITVTSGTPPVTVRLMGPGVDFTQVGEGPFEFHGLAPNTQYSVVASDECGEGQTVSTTVTTDACPEVVISQEASTPHSVTVEINGDAALVTLGDQQAMVANGGQHTFTGLSPATSYTVRAESACGYAAVSTVATAACPAISATQTATTSSITVTVTGGAPAAVTLNGQTQNVAVNGGSVTFTGLSPSTGYSTRVASNCGNEAWFMFSTAACPVITANAGETTSSIEVFVTQGAPATVTLNGQTQNVAVNGGSAVFEGLQPDTPYAFQIRSACGNEDFFTFRTASCPAVEAAVSGVGLSGFTVTFTSTDPVDVSLYDFDGRLVDARTGVTGAQVFTDLQEGAAYRIVAVNTCGQQWVQFVTTLTEEKPCPSRPIYPHGFGYVEGDVVDPAADVVIAVAGSGEVIAVYSAPAPGRTAKVRDAEGELLGYAQNQSCCTYGGCCSPEEYEASESDPPV